MFDGQMDRICNINRSGQRLIAILIKKKEPFGSVSLVINRFMLCVLVNTV